MLILGIETSCDETGVAVYDLASGLRAHALYSQIALHAEYGGVVPELASRDHVRKLLPLIRQKFPDASLHIVGRKPAPEVIALHEVGGCNVWGRVDDVRPWLKAADMALVPLNIARGVQNKVLEAMAMCLPTVLTPGAATGIGAGDGKQLAIATSDEELAAAAVKLLRDPRRARIKGLSARRFVCDHADWQTALAPMSDIVGVNRRFARNAA